MARIVVRNYATDLFGLDLKKWVEALNSFLMDHVRPVWNARHWLVLGDQKSVATAWELPIYDNSDQAGAEAYHYVTPAGKPRIAVFAKTAHQNGIPLSWDASHEIVEGVVDPYIQLWAATGKGFYAYEPADPVEETSFPIGEFPMSNFVYPTWYEDNLSGVQFDECKLVKAPLQLLKGGYATVSRNGKTTNIFGSREKEQRFAREDRRYHRTWYRDPIINRCQPRTAAS